MQITEDKVTEVFYLLDEFCQNFKKEFDGHLIGNAPKKTPIMTDSEVIIPVVPLLEEHGIH